VTGTGSEFDDRCGTLGATWRAWGATLSDMPSEAWAAPTRLPGWDVAALAAHHGMYVRGLRKIVAAPASGPPEIASAAELLRRFNVPDGAATRLAGAVADQAREISGTATPAELTARFTDDAPEVVRLVAGTGPVVVHYFSHGTIALGEALAMAVLEAAVHLLDLQRAIGVEPDVPVTALALCATMLANVADPVAFVEAATGRTTDSPLPVIR
jgi:uncharacterized protein (TIGR03083 family)